MIYLFLDRTEPTPVNDWRGETTLASQMTYPSQFTLFTSLYSQLYPSYTKNFTGRSKKSVVIAYNKQSKLTS